MPTMEKPNPLNEHEDKDGVQEMCRECGHPEEKHRYEGGECICDYYDDGVGGCDCGWNIGR